MGTKSLRNDPEVQRRLKQLQQDNTGIAKRILYPKIVKSVIPEVNKAFRTTALPSGLDKIEKKYAERVQWPRSIYKYDILKQQTLAYLSIPDIPYVNGPEFIEQFTHPWRSSTRFSFDGNLERNKRALKKAAGLPKFGKKRDNIAEAKQYVERYYNGKGQLENYYSIMPGYRTQQSSPEASKVRLVWSIPVTQWYAECVTLDDGISQTISANRGNSNNEIKLFYDTPQGVKEWYSRWQTEVVDWANIDATQYDSTVRRSELADCIHYFGGDGGYVHDICTYLQDASLVMPEGDLEREGGMPSGSKITNIGDGWTNVADILEAFDRARLKQYIRCILVNGDDISVGLSTKIDSKTLDKIGRYSRRNINGSKSDIGSYLWNSKWYIEGELLTRPIYRVLNSMMFKEHQTNPITGSKEYVAISIAQQLRDIEEHPLADVVYKSIAKIDKYPISQLEDKQLLEAAEVYLDDHNWQVDWMSDPQQMISDLKKSRYAEIAG